jgi:UDP-glucuronate decarboxylase
MLALAERCKAKILQASTSEVYGYPEEHPQTEGYKGCVNTLGPRACYDEGKRAAETLFMDYHRSHKVDIRIVRIFNTHGPGMHPFDGRVVPNFIRQAQANEPLTIYGDGTSTRSFCYREDTLIGVMRMMNSGEVGPINIGNPSEITMLALAKLIVYLTGSKSDIIRCPALVDDSVKRCPNISLAFEKLHWKPFVRLRDGLVKTIEWFNSISLADYRQPTPNY